MNLVLSILIMLLILTILVIVHEWGHYIAARIFGVKVNEFSIFMGPKIFSRIGKKREPYFLSVACLLAVIVQWKAKKRRKNPQVRFAINPGGKGPLYCLPAFL